MNQSKATQLAIKVKLEPDGTATSFEAAIKKLQENSRVNKIYIGVEPNKKKLQKLAGEIAVAIHSQKNGYEIPINTQNLASAIRSAVEEGLKVKGLKLEIGTEILGSLQKLTAPIGGVLSDDIFKVKETVEAELAEIDKKLKESQKQALKNERQRNNLSKERTRLSDSNEDTSEIDAQLEALAKHEKARQSEYKALVQQQREAKKWLKEQDSSKPLEDTLKATSASLKNIADSIPAMKEATQSLLEYKQALQSIKDDKGAPVEKPNAGENGVTAQLETLKAYSETLSTTNQAEKLLSKSGSSLSNDFILRTKAFDDASAAIGKYRSELESVQDLEHGIVEVVKEVSSRSDSSTTPEKRAKKKVQRNKKESNDNKKAQGSTSTEAPLFDIAKDFKEVQKTVSPVKDAVHDLGSEYGKLSDIVTAANKEMGVSAKVSDETVAAYQAQKAVVSKLAEEAEQKVSIYKKLDTVYKELSGYAGIEYTDNFANQADFLEKLARARDLFQKNGTNMVDWNLDELTEVKTLLAQISRMETDITAADKQDKRLTARVKSLVADELAIPKQDVSKYSKYVSGLSAAYNSYEDALIKVRKETEQGRTANDELSASLSASQAALNALLDTARKKADLSKAVGIGKNQLDAIRSDELDNLIISPKADFKLDDIKKNIDDAQSMFANGKSFVDWNLEETKQFLSLTEKINSQFSQMRSKDSYNEARENFLAQASDLRQYAQTPAVAKLNTEDAETLRTKLTEIEQLRKKLSEESEIDLDYSDIEKAEQLLKEIEPLKKRVSSQSKNAKQIDNEVRKLSNLGSRMDAYLDLNDNVRSNKELYKTFIDLRQAVESGSIAFSEADKRFAEFKLRCEQAGVATQSFSARLSKLFDDHLKTAITMFSLHLLQNSFNQMYQNVVEIDTAMVELKKVTNATTATYDRFLTNVGDRARDLGATIADVINSSADFARLGYTIDDAANLADTAIIYKNVGDGIADIGAASESVISTMKAFGIQAKDSMSIVDKFNETGNNFAISSAGIGDALMRSASALAAAGNTIDESIALVTAANTVIQDPDVVGTTMKTVSMRIRGMKTELEEAGEETETMAETTSQLRDKILALSGVDIMIDNETFKSTIQILKELGAAWDGMNDAQHAAALELLAGKRNGNVVQAILDNVELLDQVTETSMNSSGSALKENETYLDSINGKIAQFAATFEEISNNVINSEFIKVTVDAGTGILGYLNKVIEFLDAIPSIAGVAFAALATKDIGYCNNENALPYFMSMAA